MPPTAASADVPFDGLDEAQRSRVGKALAAIVKAAKKAQEGWTKTHDEIQRYAYGDDVNFLYQDWESQGGELFLKMKVAKAAQFVEVMGPYLYQYNPDYQVSPLKAATPMAMQRMQVEEAYLDYCSRRGDLYTNCRRAVGQSLIGGRGWAFTGFNKRRSCVQHVWVDAREVYDDPDAKVPEERNVLVRKRQKARWELAAMYPHARKTIMDAERAKKLPSGLDVPRVAKQVDLIDYYEIYMRVGIGRYVEGVADDNGETDDSPRKYVIIDEELIDANTWEIPFFLQDRFPGEPLDQGEVIDSILPPAPMKAGLGFLRALNWSHTLLMSQLRTSTRLPYIVLNHNGKKVPLEQLFKIIRGEYYDIAVLDTEGNEIPDIRQIIQQFPAADSLEKLRAANDIYGREFEKATGLYEILYAGETPTQLRTAEDAKLKDRNSRSRMDDRRTRVEKWMSALGSKARFAGRYLESSDAIGKMFGPGAGQVWGELASPEEVAQRQAMRQQIMAAMQQRGAPPEAAQQIADQEAPDNLVDFEQWLLEADVDVEAGSMRRRDVDQEIDVYQEANNQLVPTLLQHPDPRVQATALRISARGFEVQGAPRELVDQVRSVADLVQATPPAPPPGAAPAPAGPPR